MERLVLLANHVIAAEPAAMQRLLAHDGATLQVRAIGWPSVLPAWPDATVRVTPAGLIELVAPGERGSAADLDVAVDVSNPLAAFGSLVSGNRPRVEVAGDAALAADVNWLFDNLRWDLQDDLAPLIGPVAAHGLGRLGRTIAAALATAARAVGGLAGGARPGDVGAPPAR